MTNLAYSAQMQRLACIKTASQPLKCFHFFYCIKNTVISSALYVAGLFLISQLVSWQLIDDQVAIFGLHLTAALSFYVYWKRESWGAARYECFGAAVLLMAIGFRVVSACDTLIYGTRFEQWPLAVIVESTLLSLVIEGEAITFFGTLVMLIGWRSTVRNKVERLTFLQVSNISRNLHFKVLYCLGLFTQLITRHGGVDFGAMAQFIQISYMIGVGAIYFLARSNLKSKPLAWVIKAVLLGLPISFLALNGGMKEFIFLPLIPAVLIMWTTFSTTASRIGIVIIGICLLSISQIYAGYVRVTAWHSERNFSAAELIIGAMNEADFDLFVTGIGWIGARVNPTLSHATTMAIAERDGFIPKEIFGGIPESFIPRILWNEKPVLQPGRAHYQRITGTTLSLEDVTSASAPGFFCEMYLGAGIIGMLIFSAVFGFVVGWIQGGVVKYLPTSANAVFSFVMYYSAFRLDELAIAYSLTGMILTYILLLFIFGFISLILASRRFR